MEDSKTTRESATWQPIRQVFLREGVTLGPLPDPPRGVVSDRLAQWVLRQLQGREVSWTRQYLAIARGLSDWGLELPSELTLRARLRHLAMGFRATQWLLPEEASIVEIAVAVRNATAVSVADPEQVERALDAETIGEPLLGIARRYAAAVLERRRDGELVLNREKLKRLESVASRVLRDPESFALEELSKCKRAPEAGHAERVARLFSAQVRESLSNPHAPLPWTDPNTYGKSLHALDLMPPTDADLLFRLRDFETERQGSLRVEVRSQLVDLLRQISPQHPDPELHVDLATDRVLSRAPVWQTTFRALLNTAIQNTWRDVKRALLAGTASLSDIGDPTVPLDLDELLDVKKSIERIRAALAVAAGVDETHGTMQEALAPSKLEAWQKGYLLLRIGQEARWGILDETLGSRVTAERLKEGVTEVATRGWERRARLVLTPIVMHELAALHGEEVVIALRRLRKTLVQQETAR